MESVSSLQMADLDRKAAELYGIPALLLMENAGRGAAELILKHFAPKKALVFCGKGHNGGDGFVIARHMANAGVSVCVLLFAKQQDLKDISALNFQIIKKMGIPVEIATPLDDQKIGAAIEIAKSFDLLIDALLGIGIKGEITGDIAHAVRILNESKKPIVAIDIPSGLDADSGEIHGVCVRASVTAAMGFLKNGMLKKQGPAMCGKISVIDIGLPLRLKKEAFKPHS